MRLTACASGKRKKRGGTPRAEDSDGMENDPLNRVKDEAPTPERLTQSIELRKQMEQALAALSTGENRFRDAALGRLRIEEIAGVLKTSSNATKNTFSRGAETAARAAAFCGNKSAGARNGNGIMKHMTEEELIAYREGVAEHAR